MAIRFLCPFCQQPIEVDDDWADQEAACPYCSRVVTAPAKSTLTEADLHRVAKPVADVEVGSASIYQAAPPPPPHGVSAPAFGQVVQQDRGSALAVWALVLALIGWGSIVVVVVLLNPMFESVYEEGMTASEMQEALTQKIQADGISPGMMIAGLMFFVAAGAAVGGVVLSIVALTSSPRKRRLAIAALILSGGLPLFFCLSSVIGG